MVEARRMADEVQKQLLAQGWGSALRSGATLDEFTKEYVGHSSSTKSWKTYEADRNALKRLRETVGNIPMSSLTTNHLERFRVNELKRVKPTSVNIYLRHIKSALAFAVRNGYLEKNPASRLPLCRVAQNNIPRYLSEGEVERLRAAATDDSDLLRMIDFCLRTGARRGELVTVRWMDLDFENGLVYIRNQPNFTTKSKRGRAIPISKRLREMLEGMRPKSVDPSEKIFQSGYWSFGARFKAAVKRAGLPDSITPHVLRHTFCSFLVMAGTPMPTVKELMGHADISTSMIYTHLSGRHKSDVIDLLPF
jgi:integrase